MDSYEKHNLLSVFRVSFKVYPIYLVLFLITTILNGLYGPINLLVMQKFIDSILDLVEKNADFTPLVPLLAIIVVLQIYRHFNSSIEYFLGTKFNQKIKKHFLSMILNKISRLEYHHIENKDTYDLIHRVRKGAEENIKTSLEHLSKIISGIIRVIGLFIIVWYAGWWISLSLLLVIIFTTIVAYKSGTRKFKHSVAFSELERRIEYYEELFRDRSIKPEIKLFKSYVYIKKLFVNSFKEDIKVFFALELRNKTNTWILLRFIGLFLHFATYIILLFPLSSNVITIGFYIATNNTVSKLVAFISETVPESLQYLFESRLYWKGVNRFFKLSEKDKEVSLDKKLLSFKKIKFDNVYFKYPKSNHYILKGVSFTIDKGRHYAIVGKNGAGKSTIIKLLTGLYKVDKGEITIDGININNFNSKELCRFFSVVFQDFGKYKVSVMDNILLSELDSDRDMRRINSIADKIGFAYTVEKMTKGYDTVLGKLTEEGIDISGGEWQKLALFRLIYSNASVSILDEPTAALDPEAESRLYKLFEDSLTEDSSTILISHRLGSTKLADEIILIDEGIVKEKGSHDDLMKWKGIYKRMFDSQREWYS